MKEEKKMKRGTGETTRAIDQAIQDLFDFKRVIVVDPCLGEEETFNMVGGYINAEVTQILLNRLEAEHNLKYIGKGHGFKYQKQYPYGVKLKLKDFK